MHSEHYRTCRLLSAITRLRSQHSCSNAGIYDPDFIAANQEERADNLIKGTKAEQVEVVRGQIRDFKTRTGVDKIVVLWTANTERYAQVYRGCGRGLDNKQGEGDNRQPLICT